MAVIKCKMCGGDINLTDDKTFGTCEYCGSTMTLPRIDDEQRAAAFNRGNHFRRIGEFDKALAVYERIVQEDNTDAEAHWCCALCRFGIEYVEDPATYEYLPTCHRASFDSFLDDVDYLAALEHSDGVTRRQYQKDAAKIAEVQRGILETSSKEKPFDVFICYKETDEIGQRTRDSQLAQDIYYQLTEQGHRVFFSRITLESIMGRQYEPYIFAALNSAKVMVVVGTKAEHLNAVWVKNEWSRFLALMKRDRSRVLLPCYRDMDPYDLPEQLSVLQSYDMSQIGFMQDLIRGITKVLGKDKQPAAAKETVVIQQGASNTDALLKRGLMALEDRDWKKADEFFEEVLNQDAENAHAYWGKFLAGQQAQNTQVLIDSHRIDDQKLKKREIVPELKDGGRKEAAIQQYTVPNYLEPSEIRQCFRLPRKLSYISCSEELKQILMTAETLFAESKLLLRAEKYADDALRQEIAQARQTILSAVRKRLESEQNRDAQNEQELKEQYEAHLRQAEQRVEQLYNEACQKRDQDYQAACEKQEQDYLAACEKQSAAKTPEEFEAAAKQFELLGDFKDSAERKTVCLDRKATLEHNRQAAEKAKSKKRILIVSSVMVVLIAAVVVYTSVIAPSMQYNEAVSLKKAGKYEEAIAAFEALDGYKDSEHLLQEMHYNEAILFAETGQQAKAAIAFGLSGDYKDAAAQAVVLWDKIAVRKTISADYEHTVGLKADGTVVAVGENEDGRCDVEDWQDIVAISAGSFHTVGLKADGTVVAVGKNDDGRCDVEDWQDIVAISADGSHTVGLKSDGTVVAVGNNIAGQCDVQDWRDIIAISAGSYHTVGLKSDGTVVAAGDNDDGECDVEDWQDIVAISAGSSHTVGLKADGTVVATVVTDGYDNYSQGDVGGWSDIVAISAGDYHTVGLKSDGTVVAAGYNYYSQCDVQDWQDIVAISAGSHHTVGLKADGTAVAVGDYRYGRHDVQDWADIRLPNR